MGSLLVMSLWQGLGYNIVVLTAGLNGLNTSVLEAATIDGCNGVQRFFKVVFPMISPTVFFCTVMTIIGAFKVFAQPYFLTLGGPGESTNTIVLSLYRNGFSFDKLGYASSMAWVLFRDCHDGDGPAVRGPEEVGELRCVAKNDCRLLSRLSCWGLLGSRSCSPSRGWSRPP